MQYGRGYGDGTTRGSPSSPYAPKWGPGDPRGKQWAERAASNSARQPRGAGDEQQRPVTKRQTFGDYLAKRGAPNGDSTRAFGAPTTNRKKEYDAFGTESARRAAPNAQRPVYEERRGPSRGPQNKFYDAPTTAPPIHRASRY
eukprot:5264638-Prymnesium_polylepis.1